MRLFRVGLLRDVAALLLLAGSAATVSIASSLTTPTREIVYVSTPATVTESENL